MAKSSMTASGAERRPDFAGGIDNKALTITMSDCRRETISAAAAWIDERGILVLAERGHLDVITDASLDNLIGDERFEVGAELGEVLG